MTTRALVSFAVLAVPLLSSCTHAAEETSQPARSTPSAPAAAAPGKPTPKPDARVVITPAGGGAPITVHVEVVRSPNDIKRGLMYRQHLPPDQGMLFLMSKEEVQSFWMKNTLIPLDMLFISADKRVAGIVENTEPLTLTSRRIDEPTLYVLEVNGGWSQAHGVTAGATAAFDNVNE
ncbi:MAG TPA: DUF192 domain-containing protein [Kofleriaceae bacterium]|nr:DUF192 domain-containing protein [Kofleriaceae bacterium]